MSSATKIGKRLDIWVILLVLALVLPMLWGGTISGIIDILSAQIDVLGMIIDRWIPVMG